MRIRMGRRSGAKQCRNIAALMLAETFVLLLWLSLGITVHPSIHPSFQPSIVYLSPPHPLAEVIAPWSWDSLGSLIAQRICVGSTAIWV